MNNLKYLINLGQKAKVASSFLSNLSEKKKNEALNLFKNKIKSHTNYILKENSKDLYNAKKLKIKENILERTELNSNKIKGILNSIEEVISLKDPTNKVLSSWKRPNGLKIKRVSMPIGVIGVIYEARPNVTSDVATLCFKSGNSAILKGGKEAILSNIAISNLFRDCLKNKKINPDCAQLIKSTDRVMVDILLSKMSDYIDIIIPRGGKGLVKKVLELSKIPTIGHLEGLCHVYLDEKYNFELANSVIFNSKMRRTSICGAAETLLINKKVNKNHIISILDKLSRSGCEIIAEQEIKKIYPNSKLAKERDWATEYLDAKISVKFVKDVDAAIHHIKKYGTNHTESIISTNKKNINKFSNELSSSIIMQNTSTQFADGYEFGLGSEVGISTNKMPPRGPVGLEQLTTYKYIVEGKGQLRP